MASSRPASTLTPNRPLWPRRSFRLGLAVLTLLLACVAYRDLIAPGLGLGLDHQLVNWFYQSGHGSGRFTLLLSAWLLYRRREPLGRVAGAPGSAPVVAVLLLAGAAMLAWATYARAPDLAALSLAPIGLGLATLWGGAAAARIAAPALAVLVFAAPIPPPLYDAVVWKLQLWSTSYAAWLLGLFGTKLATSGDVIFIGEQVFEVIETCSGLRAMEILVLVSILMADLFELRRGETLVLIALAPLSAFAMNGVRVALIAITADPEAATDHVGQGVGTLLGGCLSQYAILTLLERLRRARRESSVAHAPAGLPPSRAPEVVRRRWLVVSAASFGALAIVSTAVPVAPVSPVPPLGLRRFFPARVGQWDSSERKLPRPFLGTARFREQTHRVYRLADDTGGPGVELFAAIGARERRAASPFARKTQLPGPGWIAEREEERAADFRGVSFRELVVRGGRARRLVYHLTAGDLGPVTESLRSLAAIDTTPLGGARDGVVVRLSTPLADTSPSAQRRAEARLDAFVDAFHEPLVRILEG